MTASLPEPRDSSPSDTEGAAASVEPTGPPTSSKPRAPRSAAAKRPAAGSPSDAASESTGAASPKPAPKPRTPRAPRTTAARGTSGAAARTPAAKGPTTARPAAKKPASPRGSAASKTAAAKAVATGGTQEAEITSQPAETPSVDASSVEKASVETPAVDAPAVEAPAVEAPAVEAPAVETASVVTPAVSETGQNLAAMEPLAPLSASPDASVPVADGTAGGPALPSDPESSAPADPVAPSASADAGSAAVAGSPVVFDDLIIPPRPPLPVLEPIDQVPAPSTSTDGADQFDGIESLSADVAHTDDPTPADIAVEEQATALDRAGVPPLDSRAADHAHAGDSFALSASEPEVVIDTPLGTSDGDVDPMSASDDQVADATAAAVTRDETGEREPVGITSSEDPTPPDVRTDEAAEALPPAVTLVPGVDETPSEATSLDAAATVTPGGETTLSEATSLDAAATIDPVRDTTPSEATALHDETLDPGSDEPLSDATSLDAAETPDPVVEPTPSGADALDDAAPTSTSVIVAPVDTPNTPEAVPTPDDAAAIETDGDAIAVADPADPQTTGDPRVETATPALTLRHITKTFGELRAVDAIDLTVPAGSFYGLVGPNGAGKTTTLSIIAGLLRADAGEVTINGVDAKKRAREAKKLIGVLPDRLRTFDRLTGRQLLSYYGALRGLPSGLVESRMADLARAFDLVEALARPVSDYSAGMTKKVMLAGAMIHSPRLLVLDEPFEAVDPVSSGVILDILRTYVDHGGTVILSSHGMELVERVCSRVAVIVAGQVLAEGTVDDVRGEGTLEERFRELSGGLGDVEGLEWLHTFSG
ncbi:ATP-binding cassette domain-containing protein [Microbacterium sp. VKM Ac-2923]|uniref:ATP-binding cassette domain-containing protein n=1 Tax=Microbacterium sp. VKM Ac-2923 TaxID=2929476 RepID=UPI001FB25A2D|nr:ATP-binding cassette domain-containing protein [Microbacterium sp. VKM Ac-2923]MCJ1706793.1 ATP-binding cassette domain-containing protein [Microbacterium sp. VKM Ac-2923]